MNIAFFGTGDFSASILESLIKDFRNKLNISLVVSQIDKPIGRKRNLQETPVKVVAKKYNIECLQPKKIKKSIKDSNEILEEVSYFYDKLNSLNLDFIVVVAYGKIIPKEILEIPKYGSINIHGSILPKYRGASPIQESIKLGDKETGITIMYMSEGMDEGDILSIEKIKIGETDKTTDIFRKFEIIGPKLLVTTLEDIIFGKIKAQKQEDSKATYCSKIKKEDGKISFKYETGEEIYNKFRAYFPWPGIYTYFKEKKLNLENIELIDYFGNKGFGEVEKIDKKTIGIICKNNKILILKQVKLEGKKSMDILSFINGNKDFLNYKFL